MRTDNVLKTMAGIVEKRVELYKEDFYEHDLKFLLEKEPTEFAWMVRETGTHLMADTEAERVGGDSWMHCYEVFKRSNKWFYHVRLRADGSGEVTLSEKRCDEFAARMARVTMRSAA